MRRRGRFGTGALAAVGVMALVATACSPGETDSVARPEPITVEPNDSPIVAGHSEFLVSTGEPGQPTHLVKVGVDGQHEWPEDGAMIAGTQLDDGSWFILNSSCQGTSGVCGDVGGLSLSVDGEVLASGDLWDEPGTFQVEGATGSLVLVSVRTDTAVTAYWVDARTVKEVDQAFRSAPYNAAAIRDAAETAGGEAEFDTPRFRFCAGDDSVYVLSSPEHLGSTGSPSRTVEVVPTPAAVEGGDVARLFEVDVDSFDARLAGALMCGDGRLTNVTVGPSDDGGSEVTLSSLDVVTGEADERSLAIYDTPLVDLYGGGDTRALLSVAEFEDLPDPGDMGSEGGESEGGESDDSQSDDSQPDDGQPDSGVPADEPDPSDEPPSELVVITDEGEVISVGEQAPSGPALLSLDGAAVLQPDGDSVQVDRID